MSAKVRAQAIEEQRRRRHGLDARQIFPILRERLLASRPVTVVEVPAAFRPVMPSEVRAGRAPIDAKGKPARVKVPAHSITLFGRPTFRNIYENGKHV